MVVGATAGELVAVAGQALGELLGVGNDLLSVLLELGRASLLEGDGHGGNGVVVRATLARGEDGLVDAVLEVITTVAAEEDQTSAGATEGLVGGGGDDVAEVEGRLGLFAGNQTGNVGHVAHEVGAVLVGDLAHGVILELTRVGGGTADEELGAEERSVLLEALVVNEAGLGVDLVGHRLEVDGRRRDLLLVSLIAVGQMATGGKVQTHQTVLRLDQGSQGSKVGGRATVGLHVDAPLLGIQTERGQGTGAAELLELIDELVTTIVTGTGETLGVLVGQRSAVGFNDGLRGKVLLYLCVNITA